MIRPTSQLQRPIKTTAGSLPLSARLKAGGFLHIVRHGTGSGTMYVLTYHRLQRDAKPILAQPMLAESPQLLIDILEKVGVDFRLREVRGALADILRLGSANIPDLWLAEDVTPKPLTES
jgi:hypothetical protein